MVVQFRIKYSTGSVQIKPQRNRVKVGEVVQVRQLGIPLFSDRKLLDSSKQMFVSSPSRSNSLLCQHQSFGTAVYESAFPFEAYPFDGVCG